MGEREEDGGVVFKRILGSQNVHSETSAPHENAHKVRILAECCAMAYNQNGNTLLGTSYHVLYVSVVFHGTSYHVLCVSVVFHRTSDHVLFVCGVSWDVRSYIVCVCGVS